MMYIILLFTLFVCVCAFSQKRFIEVDNSKIWINTIGLENRKEGHPVVVFESGYGTPMDNWDKVIAGQFVHIDDPELLISSIRIVLHDYELLKQEIQKK